MLEFFVYKCRLVITTVTGLTNLFYAFVKCLFQRKFSFVKILMTSVVSRTEIRPARMVTATV